MTKLTGPPAIFRKIAILFGLSKESHTVKFYPKDFNWPFGYLLSLSNTFQTESAFKF